MRARKKPVIISLRGRTVWVGGEKIGYQFAQKSMGTRKYTHKVVTLEAPGADFGTVRLLGRTVKVVRIAGSSYHWEVLEVVKNNESS